MHVMTSLQAAPHGRILACHTSTQPALPGIVSSYISMKIIIRESRYYSIEYVKLHPCSPLSREKTRAAAVAAGRCCCKRRCKWGFCPPGASVDGVCAAKPGSWPLLVATCWSPGPWHWSCRGALPWYALNVQGLRGKATQAVDVAGVETPHDRAGEVLPPIDSSNGPQEPALPSGAICRSTICRSSSVAPDVTESGGRKSTIRRSSSAAPGVTGLSSKAENPAEVAGSSPEQTLPSCRRAQNP